MMRWMQEEALEESGWKLVHGDVFRPPLYRRLLVALTGAGIQIFLSTFIVIGNLVQSIVAVYGNLRQCDLTSDRLLAIQKVSGSYLTSR